jgi:nucleoside-diphosphate-sugar epimerase
MKVLITGEKGFIARNLPKSFSKLGVAVVSLESPDLIRTQGGEVCVWRNSEADWSKALHENEVDLIVHNAAVVGTDVVALNPHEATHSNVTGTYTVCRAANSLGIPVCYLGTTVIYDTPLYQDSAITEESVRGPNTLYGAHKLASEHIVKSHCDRWLIIRPLFAYGGVGDMNSLIAKSLYASLDDSIDYIDMFLDPKKIKDYLHVEDFCDAVSISCQLGLWNNDYNIAAETPIEVGRIVDMMTEISGRNVQKKIKWFPQTDYLGNHVLSCDKFHEITGWSPNYSLREGIISSWESISNDSESDYNPLKYLQEAKRKNIDLTQFF